MQDLEYAIVSALISFKQSSEFALIEQDMPSREKLMAALQVLTDVYVSVVFVCELTGNGWCWGSGRGTGAEQG